MQARSPKTLLLVGMVWPAIWSGVGCRQDANLSHRPLRSVTVHPVTLYGVTLDKNASPKQVAYVLLRAIREDFLAKTREARSAALDKQLDLAAADVLPRMNPTPMTREEFINRVVYLWTPTVSHYVHDFETEWEPAERRLKINKMRVQEGSDSGEKACEVLMEVNDPSGEPNARVVMAIYMAQDEGFWRVLHLGFIPTTRSIPDGLTSSNDVANPSATASGR